MRATDGRPYELQSIPTKTVAVRSTDNGADLVQNLCLHPCLHLEGKVPAQPADEVKFKSVRKAHTTTIHCLLFIRFCRRTSSRMNTSSRSTVIAQTMTMVSFCS